jgi:renalase
MKLAGVCAEWSADIRVIENGVLQAKKDAVAPTRYVGVPGMSALGRYFSDPVSGSIVFNTRIECAEQQSGRWQLKTDEGKIWPNTFTHLVITAPAEQASTIVPAAPQHLLQYVKQRTLAPCWCVPFCPCFSSLRCSLRVFRRAVMLGFSHRQQIDFDAAFVNHHDAISWISRDSSKPGRSNGSDCWVVHASKEFSKTHLEEKPEKIAEIIMQSFLALPMSTAPLDRPSMCVAHRWRYSIPEDDTEHPALWDPATKLGYAGDWTSGSRVEGAFLSGVEMAEKIRQDMGQSRM